MKPRLRLKAGLRATFKWSCAAITVMLLIAWVGSAKYAAGFLDRSSTNWVLVESGQLLIIYYPPLNAADFADRLWVFQRSEPPFRWWFRSGYASTLQVFRWMSIPIWSIALLPAAPAILMFRRDQRRRTRGRTPGLCFTCGYNRTGLPSDHTCPECGSTPA